MTNALFNPEFKPHAPAPMAPRKPIKPPRKGWLMPSMFIGIFIITAALFYAAKAYAGTCESKIVNDFTANTATVFELPSECTTQPQQARLVIPVPIAAAGLAPVAEASGAVGLCHMPGRIWYRGKCWLKARIPK